MEISDENEHRKEVYQCPGSEQTSVNIKIDGHPRDSWRTARVVVLQSSTSKSAEVEIINRDNQVIQEFTNIQAAREWLKESGCTLISISI